MAQTTAYCCDRFGSSVLEGRSILEIEAGTLVRLHDDPRIDLCGPCTDRFVDWLRSGQEGARMAWARGLPTRPRKPAARGKKRSRTGL